MVEFQTTPYELAITGGTVITPAGEWRGDIGVAGGRIAALVAPGTPLDAERTLDATGRHVLPGVIDPHVHMPTGDAFPAICERETRSLIAGGVTTAMVFVAAPHEPYGPVLAQQIAEVPRVAHCDVAFSPIIESIEHVRELPQLAREHGATSYKMYFAAGGRELYPATVAIDDGVLYEALGRSRRSAIRRSRWCTPRTGRSRRCSVIGCAPRGERTRRRGASRAPTRSKRSACAAPRTTRGCRTARSTWCT